MQNFCEKAAALDLRQVSTCLASGTQSCQLITLPPTSSHLSSGTTSGACRGSSGDSDVSPLHVDYFELKIIKAQQAQAEFGTSPFPA